MAVQGEEQQVGVPNQNSTTVASNEEEAQKENNAAENVKRKVPCPSERVELDEECESTICSSIQSTSTGNLLGRVIHDPERIRPPALAKWPVNWPKTDTMDANNNHQYKASFKTTPLEQMQFLRVDCEVNSYRTPAIVATIGEGSSSVQSVVDLLEAGMNVARVNLAHMDPCSRVSTFRIIKEAVNLHSIDIDFNLPICTMVDLKGPEIRTGRIHKKLVKNPSRPELMLKKGTTVRLTSDNIFENSCTEKIIYVDCESLALHVRPGMEIFISDGDVKLEVESVESFHIVCNVIEDCILHNYQQVHIPLLPLPLPAITSCDLECLELALKQEVDVVVVPKVRSDTIIYKIKTKIVDKQEEYRTLVFAKISNYEGVKNIEKIIMAADGIVIQRNDLKVDLPQRKLFLALKEIIAKCNTVGKPVICTVPLEYTTLPNHVKYDQINAAQCIIDGADCLMLTSATAVGNQGPAYVGSLSELIREAEAATMQQPFFDDLTSTMKPSIEPVQAICLAAVDVSNKIRSSAIIAITTSGKTAQMLSWFRPRCPIIAVTRVGKVARQLNLWRGVLPVHFLGPLQDDWFEDCKSRMQYGILYGRKRKIIRSGDALVLVSGFRKEAGFTNCLRVVFAAVQEDQYVNNMEQYFAGTK